MPSSSATPRGLAESARCADLLDPLNVSELAASALVRAADVAAALEELLPDIPVQVLAVHTSPAALDGVWCDPVALPVGPGWERVSVALPPSLVASLAAAGCSLRVVLSHPGSGEPLSDTRLPHDTAGGWQESGELTVSVPCGLGPLLWLSLLAVPAAPPPGTAVDAEPEARVDAFLASLPLLVLAPAAAEEVQQLWATMVADWMKEEQVEEVADAAAAVYASHLVPFACDFGALCTPPASADPGDCAAAPAVIDFLEANGLTACMSALWLNEDPEPSTLLAP